MSVVVPTYNEAGNLPVLLDRLSQVLSGSSHEIIVVDDDSPDGTWRIALERSAIDPRIRVIRRMDDRGLSSAVLAGMDAASGSVLAVLDADLQHDEAILPDLIAAVGSGRADVAIGSREAPGGSYGEFGRARRLLSYIGAKVASTALGVDVSDPMSGYFALSSDRYATIRPSVNPRGFKILLDVLANGERPTVEDVGYRFRARRSGDTKLSGGVIAAFGLSVAELALARARSGVLNRADRPIAGERTAGRSAVSRRAAPSDGDQGRLITYAAVVALATGVRLAGSSLLTGFSLTGVAGPLAIELGILVEYACHQRLTFPQAPGQRRRLTAARRLATFHAIAGGTLLAHAGIGEVVIRILSGSDGWSHLVAALGVSTGGIMATTAIAYGLNRRSTWSLTPTGSTGRAPRRTTSAWRRGDGHSSTDQESRPMTRSTSDAISSTARR